MSGKRTEKKTRGVRHGNEAEGGVWRGGKCANGDEFDLWLD